MLLATIVPILSKGILSKDMFSPESRESRMASRVLMEEMRSPSENSYLLVQPVGVYLSLSIITQWIQARRNTSRDLSFGPFRNPFGPMLPRVLRRDCLIPSENSKEVLKEIFNKLEGILVVNSEAKNSLKFLLGLLFPRILSIFCSHWIARWTFLISIHIPSFIPHSIILLATS